MSETSRTDARIPDQVYKRTMYDHIQVIERELTEARELLIKCLSIMPVGYIPTHTAENLPEMIGDLAKALAEETTEREQLERELAEARQQRDTLAKTVRVYLDTERDGGILYSDALSELQEALAAVKG